MLGELLKSELVCDKDYENKLVEENFVTINLFTQNHSAQAASWL